MLRRSTIVWLAIRAALFAGRRIVAPAFAAPASVESLPLSAVVLIVVITVALVLFDLRRSGEKLFLANLGIPTLSLGVLAAVPPLFLEIVLDVMVL